jgi:hypothetical protein
LLIKLREGSTLSFFKNKTEILLKKKAAILGSKMLAKDQRNISPLQVVRRLCVEI